MPIVGVDLDSVLADLSGAFIREWNTAYPRTPIDRPYWDCCDLHEKLGISKSHFHKIMNRAWGAYPSMETQEPEEDIHLALKRLRRAGCAVWIVSNRHISSHWGVACWLALKKIEYDVLILNHEGPDKMAYPIDCLVDDNPKEAGKVREGKRLYLRDQACIRDGGDVEGKVMRVWTLGEAVKRVVEGL